MYTVITVVIDQITVYGSPIGQTPESVQLLTDKQVSNFAIGQKLTFADWIIYLFYVWSLKCAMLSIYWGLALVQVTGAGSGSLLTSRARKGLPKYSNIVLAAMAFVFLTFVASLLAHLCGCLPIHRNWQIVPYPGGIEATPQFAPN